MSGSAKRSRVMARSRRLGHCICDPHKPCPCDLLLECDVCTCAGERLPVKPESADRVALTKLVRNAGCASKIAPADLARILARLPVVRDPRVVVSGATADDAGVFRLSDDLWLVQTVDVFSPCVDDPYLFGRIAAANSLSDCYAMGGTPLTALSIIGYPAHSLGEEPVAEMLRGGMEALAEAGVALVGGHSINDEEIKLGFSITGVIRPEELVTNAGAQPGDALLLTKPLGTGIIAFAAQIGRGSEEALRAASASMTALNREAAAVMKKVGARACTDVTGFGLLGHLWQVARESRVTAELWWEAVPLLPGVREYAAEGIAPGATERNREFAGPAVTVEEGVAEEALDVLYDAQTSGGLLIAVPGDRAREALARLREAGCREAAIIGRVVERSQGGIIVRATSDHGGDSRQAPGRPEATASPREECCAPGAAAVGAGSAGEAGQRFFAAAFAPGVLDVVQKEITAIALSVALRCGSCLRLHLDKARGMGLTAQEIEEAAWMGVAFGGAPSMLLWTEASRDLRTAGAGEMSRQVEGAEEPGCP